MPKEVEIRLGVSDLGDKKLIRDRIEKQFETSPYHVSDFRLLRKSLDARQRTPYYVMRYEVFFDDERKPATDINIDFQDVHNAPSVHIVGAGPAGYFAALECLILGLKPILFERGKDVQARRRDLKSIQQDSIVNPESNYCFGEGGAGTYSDGKLYTRSGNKKKIKNVLEMLYLHGAKEEILYEAHPHIGSNKLPKIIANIRDTIENMGGEIYFDSKLTDLHVSESIIDTITINESQTEKIDHLILATGHSARDIYLLLHKKGIKLEFKEFAMGVRIEHPQALINDIQYHGYKSVDLPAASYSLVSQLSNRAVFSFCMCPGGLIVPAATAPGEIVLNGMSLSRRDSPFANSGVVCQINKEDLKQYQNYGPLAGLYFQMEVEKNTFNHGDGSQKAPSVRLTDYVRNKVSSSLPETSYIPGIYSADLKEILPTFVSESIRQGVKEFNKKMPGYLTDLAIIAGVESRTSSPVRIPRQPESCCHVEISNLFPTGEGAGFAGGIVSAAIDGQRVVQSLYKMTYNQ